MGSFMHGLWLPRTVINPKMVDPVSHRCDKDVTLGCEEHLSQVRFGRSETSRTRRGRRLRLYPLKVALSAPKTSLLQCLGAAALRMRARNLLCFAVFLPACRCAPSAPAARTSAFPPQRRSSVPDSPWGAAKSSDQGEPLSPETKVLERQATRDEEALWPRRAG